MNKRRSNFELIRIVAMLMIVAAHYVGHGIFKVSSADAYTVYLEGEKVNQLISTIYSPGGKTGVALYFMISGYFLSNKKMLTSQKSCSTMLVLCSITNRCFFYSSSPSFI